MRERLPRNISKINMDILADQGLVVEPGGNIWNEPVVPLTTTEFDADGSVINVAELEADVWIRNLNPNSKRRKAIVLLPRHPEVQRNK